MKPRLRKYQNAWICGNDMIKFWGVSPEDSFYNWKYWSADVWEKHDYMDEIDRLGHYINAADTKIHAYSTLIVRI